MKKPVALTAMLLGIAGVCQAGQSQTYSLTEIPTLGGNFGYGSALNNAGQVTGYAYTDATATHSSEVHAFLYRHGRLRDLGTLGGSSSTGVMINARGQVTGSADTPNFDHGFFSHAFLYGHGLMQDLGTLGGNSSGGASINARGQVTGSAQTNDGSPFCDPPGCDHAFLYTNGVMQDLGTLGGILSAGVGINASGQVTGFVITSNGEEHAFLYKDGSMTDLGTLGGNFSVGIGINDAGQVAGAATTSAGVGHAFLYSNGTMKDLTPEATTTIDGHPVNGGAGPINASGQVTGYGPFKGNVDSHAFLYSKGKTTDLGTLGTGTASFGNSINASGQVVGVSFTSERTEPHAFVYRKGRMLDLNELIDEGSPLKPYVTLTTANAINDAGDILVLGFNSRTQTDHAYLLRRCRGSGDKNPGHDEVHDRDDDQHSCTSLTAQHRRRH